MATGSERNARELPIQQDSKACRHGRTEEQASAGQCRSGQARAGQGKPGQVVLTMAAIISIIQFDVDCRSFVGPEKGAARRTPHEAKERVRFESSSLELMVPSPIPSMVSEAKSLCNRIRCS